MKCVHDGGCETIYELACPSCSYGAANYVSDHGFGEKLLFCPRCGHMKAIHMAGHGDGAVDADTRPRRRDCHVIEHSHARHATWRTEQCVFGPRSLYGSCGDGDELRRFIQEVKGRAGAAKLLSGGYVYRDGVDWLAKDVCSGTVLPFDAWIASMGSGLGLDEGWQSQVAIRLDPVLSTAHRTKGLPYDAGTVHVPGIDIAIEAARRQRASEVLPCPQALNPSDLTEIRAILEYQRDLYAGLSASGAVWPGDSRRAHFYGTVLGYMDRGYSYGAVSTVAVWGGGLFSIEAYLLLPALHLPNPCADPYVFSGFTSEWETIAAVTEVAESDILGLCDALLVDAQLDPATPRAVRNTCLARCNRCRVGLFGPSCWAGWFTRSPIPNAGVHPESGELCEFPLEMTVLGQDAF